MQNENEIIEIEILMGDNEFGSVSLTETELETECNRLTDIYTEIEGSEYSISVRPPRCNEAPGNYYVKADGTLQILGYSLDMEDLFPGLSDILSQGWEIYCKG